MTQKRKPTIQPKPKPAKPKAKPKAKPAAKKRGAPVLVPPKRNAPPKRTGDDGLGELLPTAFYTLPDEQKRFVIEFLRTGNATAAMRRAGAAISETASPWRWLNSSPIREVVAYAQNEMWKREAMDVLETRTRISRMARAKITDVAQWAEEGDAETGKRMKLKLLASDDLSEAAAASIKEISIDDDGAMKLKMHDPQAAQTNLARIHGLFKDDTGASDGVILGVIRRLAEKERDAKAVDAKFTEEK